MVELHFLLTVFPKDAHNLKRGGAYPAIALNPEPLKAKFHIACIRPAEIRFGQAQVMNSIQQIGFTNAVGTTKPYHPLIEL